MFKIRVPVTLGVASQRQDSLEGKGGEGGVPEHLQLGRLIDEAATVALPRNDSDNTNGHTRLRWFLVERASPPPAAMTA